MNGVGEGGGRRLQIKIIASMGIALKIYTLLGGP